MTKRILLTTVLLGLICGCAQEASVSSNQDNLRYYNAWIRANNDGTWKQTTLGVWYSDDVIGTGAELSTEESNRYVLVKYDITDFRNNELATLYDSIARKTGIYDATYQYHSHPVDRTNIEAGISNGLTGMKVGGERTLYVPGWLKTVNRYGALSEYLINITETHFIYHVKLEGIISDITTWETDSLYAFKNKAFSGVTPTDTLAGLLFYYRTREPSSTRTFPSDTTIYINYIVKRLDGGLVDTNYRDSAKYYLKDQYYEGTTYSPMSVTWNATYTSITASSSSLITGLSYPLSIMKAHEKGISIFTSAHGYSSTTGNQSIPPYTPLMISIELVDEP